MPSSLSFSQVSSFHSNLKSAMKNDLNNISNRRDALKQSSDNKRTQAQNKRQQATQKRNSAPSEDPGRKAAMDAADALDTEAGSLESEADAMDAEDSALGEIAGEIEGMLGESDTLISDIINKLSNTDKYYGNALNELNSMLNDFVKQLDSLYTNFSNQNFNNEVIWQPYYDQNWKEYGPTKTTFEPGDIKTHGIIHNMGKDTVKSATVDKIYYDIYGKMPKTLTNENIAEVRKVLDWEGTLHSTFFDTSQINKSNTDYENLQEKLSMPLVGYAMHKTLTADDYSNMSSFSTRQGLMMDDLIKTYYYCANELINNDNGHLLNTFYENCYQIGYNIPAGTKSSNISPYIYYLSPVFIEMSMFIHNRLNKQLSSLGFESTINDENLINSLTASSFNLGLIKNFFQIDYRNYDYHTLGAGNVSSGLPLKFNISVGDPDEGIKKYKISYTDLVEYSYSVLGYNSKLGNLYSSVLEKELYDEIPKLSDKLWGIVSTFIKLPFFSEIELGFEFLNGIAKVSDIANLIDLYGIKDSLQIYGDVKRFLETEDGKYLLSTLIKQVNSNYFGGSLVVNRDGSIDNPYLTYNHRDLEFATYRYQYYNPDQLNYSQWFTKYEGDLSTRKMELIDRYTLYRDTFTDDKPPLFGELDISLIKEFDEIGKIRDYE